MLEYYNILKFATGGALASLAGSSVEWLFKRIASGNSAKKLHGLSSMFSSRSPELATELKALNKMVKDKLAGVANITDALIKALIKKTLTLAKPVFQNTKLYKDRLANILQWRLRASQAANSTQAAGLAVSQTAGQAATEQAKKATVGQAATEQAKKATVGSWFTGVGNWLNKHPAITVPAMLIGGGTGIGRWAVGSGIKASQWSPDSVNTNISQGDFLLMPDGNKYQIKRGADGNFLIISGNSMSTDSADDSAIDAAINAATNNQTDNVANMNLSGIPDPSLLPLDTINEIFGALL